jgi:hypothetical protein
MKKFLIVLFSLACTFFLFASVQLRVVTETVKGQQSASILADNLIVAKFYGTEAGVGGPVERANLLMARLTQLAALGVDPEDSRFWSGIEKDQTFIRFDGQPLCRIVELETIINKTNDVLLAKEWLERIRVFLRALPQDSQYVKDDIALPVKGIAVRFNPVIKSKDYIVAHRTLPIGMKVRIVNLQNRWSLVAEIAERNIPSGDAIIALAPNTAEALGVTQNRKTKVLLEKR